jgi:predicted DsbA family dithiol-disulfide isomerase
MALDRTDTLRIDIVSDVVCPWCIIGYRQLARAIEVTGTRAEIHWHPFELNPQMPPEGQDLRDHIAQKYGTTPDQSRAARERLTALGQELGFSFAYVDDMRMVNTFQAHQAIHWAGQQGRAHDMKQALFAAYFSEGRDVSAPQVLVGCAVALGLDGDALRTALAGGLHADEVRRQAAFWTSQGITGVPAVVFDGKYLLVGAQGVDGYSQALTQLAAARA